MAGTTARNPSEGLIDEPVILLTDAAPTAAQVEAELQQIARLRLAPKKGDIAPTPPRTTRSFRQRRGSITGAFDSPDGFAFAAAGANRRK